MHILLADDDESMAMVARLGLRRGRLHRDRRRRGAGPRFRPHVRPPSTRSSWTGTCPTSTASTSVVSCMADPAWTKVPIVFLTAASHDGAEQEALAAGARGVHLQAVRSDDRGRAGQGAHHVRQH